MSQEFFREAVFDNPIAVTRPRSWRASCKRRITRQRRGLMEVAPLIAATFSHATSSSIQFLSSVVPLNTVFDTRRVTRTPMFLNVAPGEASPVFQDPVYARSKYWRMSTSHLTHEMFDGWGWGEVVPDGEQCSTFRNRYSLGRLFWAPGVLGWSPLYHGQFVFVRDKTQRIGHQLLQKSDVFIPVSSRSVVTSNRRCGLWTFRCIQRVRICALNNRVVSCCRRRQNGLFLPAAVSHRHKGQSRPYLHDYCRGLLRSMPAQLSYIGSLATIPICWCYRCRCGVLHQEAVAALHDCLSPPPGGLAGWAVPSSTGSIAGYASSMRACCYDRL